MTIGFVHLSQHVKIMLAVFSFQQHGMVEGEVVHVGADAQLLIILNAMLRDQSMWDAANLQTTKTA